MRFKPIALSIEKFDRYKSEAFRSAQTVDIKLLLANKVTLDPKRHLIIQHDGREFLLPFMNALSPASIKNICKSILSSKIKSAHTAKWLSKTKNSGQLVFYKPDQNDPPEIMSMPCIWNLLFKDKPIVACTNVKCKKQCKYINVDIDNLQCSNIQLNRSKTVIPISEIIEKGFVDKLKGNVLRDYTRSKDDIEKILDTPTNIGPLSAVFMKGSQNIFRLMALKRVAKWCGRAVLSPSPDDYVYLPVEMFNALFCYDEGSKLNEHEYCYLIRYPITMYMQVLLFKCKPWNGKTIKMPTWALKLYNGDFDGDQVSVFPVNDSTAAIHTILDTSILFNMCTGQVNLHAPPAALLYTDVENYERFIVESIEEGIICNRYSRAIDRITKQLAKDYKACNETDECVSLRDLLEFKGVIKRLPKATRFSSKHVEQLTTRIGHMTGVLSGQSTIVNSNYVNGISRNELFPAAICCREGVVASKIEIPQAGDVLTNLAFVTPTLIVEDAFYITYMKKDVKSFTCLNMLCKIVIPSKGFLGLCIQEFEKIYI